MHSCKFDDTHLKFVGLNKKDLGIRNVKSVISFNEVFLTTVTFELNNYLLSIFSEFFIFFIGGCVPLNLNLFQKRYFISRASLFSLILKFLFRAYLDVNEEQKVDNKHFLA